MAYKDQDEFLDALYEHIFEGDDDPDDEWFSDRVVKFFDQFKSNNDNQGGSNNQAPRRRQRADNGGGQGGNAPRRRRRATANASGDMYGNTRFFGGQ
jgi:hypothetical protein